MDGSDPVAGSVLVIGERALVEGYGLAGAVVVVAEDPDAVRNAVRDLPSDAALVILTRAAAAVLDPALGPASDAGHSTAMSTGDRQVVIIP